MPIFVTPPAGKAGFLSVISAPQEANLKVGARFATIPGDVLFEYPGTYRLHVVMPNFLPSELTLSIPRSKDIVIFLKKALPLTSKPENPNSLARINLDYNQAVSFVKTYLGESDLNKSVALYADTVDYYASGMVKKAFVQQDKAAYFVRWTSINNQLDSTVHTVSASSGKRTVSFNFTFQVKNGSKKIAGRAFAELKLQIVNGHILIVSEKGYVYRKQDTKSGTNSIVNFIVKSSVAQTAQLTVISAPSKANLVSGSLLATIPGPVLFPYPGKYRLSVTMTNFAPSEVGVNVPQDKEVVVQLNAPSTVVKPPIDPPATTAISQGSAKYSVGNLVVKVDHDPIEGDMVRVLTTVAVSNEGSAWKYQMVWRCRNGEPAVLLLSQIPMGQSDSERYFFFKFNNGTPSGGVTWESATDEFAFFLPKSLIQKFYSDAINSEQLVIRQSFNGMAAQNYTWNIQGFQDATKYLTCF